MEEEKIINGNCWVACFDILGFKEAILGFEQGYGVGHLDKFANYIYKEILDILQSGEILGQGRVYTCWASDTFVLYTPDDSGTSFKLISAAAINFFCKMIRRRSSYMMRGALGTGQFYVDKQNNIFLGSAFINAYAYAEKRDWIGFVVTPSAKKKIDDIELKIPPQTLLYRNQFIQYDVPIKKKKTRKELSFAAKIKRFFLSRRKESKKELLFAAKIQSRPAIKEFFRPRQKGTPQKEWAKKYENTRRFFEQHP